LVSELVGVLDEDHCRAVGFHIFPIAFCDASTDQSLHESRGLYDGEVVKFQFCKGSSCLSYHAFPIKQLLLLDFSAFTGGAHCDAE
jgi:hypothetical protein